MKVEAGESFIRMISTLKHGLSNDIIKWTNTGNIHLILAFLGNNEEKMIKTIIYMLKGKCEGSGKFELIIIGIGVSRNLNDPRIIWERLKTLIQQFQEFEIQIVPVNQIILYESILLQSGPVYKPLINYQLICNLLSLDCSKPCPLPIMATV